MRDEPYEPVHYADWQQRRGAVKDIIREQIEDWVVHYACASGHVVSEVYRTSLANDIATELEAFIHDQR